MNRPFSYGVRVIVALAFLLTPLAGVLAVWDGNAYEPGETLDPECAPADASCTVEATTLQTAYREGNGLTTINARDIEFTLADTATDSNLIVNLAGQGDFSIKDNGTTFATFSDDGTVTFTGAVIIGGEAVTDLTGSGVLLSGGALTLDRTGAWTGTFDGQEGAYYLDRANQTGSQTASTISDFAIAVGSYISGSSTVPHVAGSASGDLLYWTGSSWGTRATSTLGIGGGGGGSVTSVDASGGTTGLSFTGGPITTSGALTLAGTLTVANGGTGSTTLSGLIKGAGTGGVQTAIPGIDYVASTAGDWTGTFDGQEGTYYLSRANQTGFQTASTISDFSTSARGLVSAGSGLTYDSGTGAFTLDATGAWTGTFDGQEGTYYLSRANQTGTQLASTVSDFNTTSRGLFSAGSGLSYNGGTGAFTLDATGAWTGTFDGQEGTYYLDARNQTNFGTPFYALFSATTTDALTQGSTNRYYSDAAVGSYITASTTLPGFINYWGKVGSALSYLAGNVGIGTTTPNRKLEVLESNAAPHLRLSKGLTIYADVTVDSTGDLKFTTTGGDIRAMSENLWICNNDSCPVVTATSTTGNLFVENATVFGNGFSLNQVSSTELGLYDHTGTQILIFDEGL